MSERITSGQLINALAILLEKMKPLLADDHNKFMHAVHRDRELKWAVTTLEAARQQHLDDLTPDLFDQATTTPRRIPLESDNPDSAGVWIV